MTRFRLLVLVAALAPVVGCTSIKEWLDRDRHPAKGAGELPPVEAERLVAFVNMRAARMQSLSADVRITASDRGVRMPATLTGSLAAQQPKNFRTRAKALAAEVDLGSNAEQFWVYFDAPPKPMYVFASHSDFQEGKAKLPGGIPFEPEWVMQALGMLPLPAQPPKGAYSAPAPDQKARTYTLRWEAVTPAGVPVVKEIVFDGDPATGSRPQVKRHVVRDAKGGKVICSAEIKSAKTVDLNNDPQQAVQYPTRVALKWEEQKFEMDLELSGAKVNDLTAADSGGSMFRRPTIASVPAYDLAEYRFQPK
jgi:hypothetical protein